MEDNLTSTSARSDEFVAEILTTIDGSARLPDWPFRNPAGYVSICHWESIFHWFGPVLEALVTFYQDERVTMAALAPVVAGFGTRADPPSDDLISRMLAGASVDPVDFRHEVDVLALSGSSGRWAVWGQSVWGLAILLTPDRVGPWLNAGLPFDGPRDALHEIRPKGSAEFLTRIEIETFLRNVDEAAARAPRSAYLETWSLESRLRIGDGLVDPSERNGPSVGRG